MGVLPIDLGVACCYQLLLDIRSNYKQLSQSAFISVSGNAPYSYIVPNYQVP